MQSRQRWGISRLILRIVVSHRPRCRRAAHHRSHGLPPSHTIWLQVFSIRPFLHGHITHLRLQYTHAFPADLFVRFFRGSSALPCSSGSSFTPCFLAPAGVFFCDGPALSEESAEACWSVAGCAA